MELDISISTQSNLFLHRYNSLLCFFFFNFVSCCNFIVISKDKENNKENTVTKPSSCLSVLTCVKIIVDENTVKTAVNILLI